MPSMQTILEDERRKIIMHQLATEMQRCSASPADEIITKQDINLSSARAHGTIAIRVVEFQVR